MFGAWPPRESDIFPLKFNAFRSGVDQDLQGLGVTGKRSIPNTSLIRFLLTAGRPENVQLWSEATEGAWTVPSAMEDVVIPAG